MVVEKVHEDPPGQCRGYPADVAPADPTVAIEIEPQTPHRPDGHTVLGRPARVVGIIHIPAFTGDDLVRNVVD